MWGVCDMGYKGDSPGKKYARARLWYKIDVLLRIFKEECTGVLVLAGEGGDISTLAGISQMPGPSPGAGGFSLGGTRGISIHAVDYDKDYADLCWELFPLPGVEAVHGAASEIAPCVTYNVAHLDFCGGLTLENIQTVADVIRNANNIPVLIGVTMLKGREARETINGSTVAKMSRPRRRMVLRGLRKQGDLRGAQLLQKGVFDPRITLRRCEEKLRAYHNPDSSIFRKMFTRTGSLTPLGRAEIRVDALRCLVNTLLLDLHTCIPGGVELHTLSTMSYHSKSDHSAGTPFVTALYMAHAGCESEVLREILNITGGRVISVDCQSGGDAESELRKLALDLSNLYSTKRIAALLDIDPKTITAWKAHETRGTYK